MGVFFCFSNGGQTHRHRQQRSLLILIKLVPIYIARVSRGFIFNITNPTMEREKIIGLIILALVHKSLSISVVSNFCSIITPTISYSTSEKLAQSLPVWLAYLQADLTLQSRVWCHDIEVLSPELLPVSVCGRMPLLHHAIHQILH